MKFAVLIALAWAVTGCGCGGGNEGNGTFKGSDQTSLEALNRAATEYGGDWSKVPPEDKALILIRFDKDEDAAIATLKSMSKGDTNIGGTKTPPPTPKGVGQGSEQEHPQGGSMGIH